ncbi:hypothetical protein [Bacillus sp. FJAT-45350]|uniref:hypothetical protein n=1 Tax=Bacillus sp. FJAT-45350 TaxID=2011014 RepID=UPI000BB8F00C|nr:hypothetical protein [Bacillus sp. FJAT-45350]
MLIEKMKQSSSNKEVTHRRLGLIVKQMKSDDPMVRDYALTSLDEMVDEELKGQLSKDNQIEKNELDFQEPELVTSRKDSDVLFKIRLLQREKEKEQKRKKPFLINWESFNFVKAFKEMSKNRREQL